MSDGASGSTKKEKSQSATENTGAQDVANQDVGEDIPEQQNVEATPATEGNKSESATADTETMDSTNQDTGISPEQVPSIYEEDSPEE